MADISRNIFDPAKHYRGVRMQQGRVLLDDDWNENERIRDYEQLEQLSDIIGQTGTSDDGFRVSFDGEGVRNESNGGDTDFYIQPGTYYVNGLRCTLDQTAQLGDQPDWHHGIEEEKLKFSGKRRDLVFLRAWEQDVTASEDGELFEVALGGPDTTTRRRVFSQIDSISIDKSEVEKIIQRELDPYTLLPNGKSEVELAVGFQEGEGITSLCEQKFVGGYLGAENHTIRVQLVDADHFTWGYDNGSRLHRITVSGKTVTLLDKPNDETMEIRDQQVVEILPHATQLPNGEFAAMPCGQMTRLIRSGSDLLLQDGLTIGGQKEYFMRVWDRGADTASAPEISVGKDVELANTGILLSFDGAGTQGDFWTLTLRPEAREAVVPWELMSGMQPHGPIRHSAPLAIIKWKSGGASGKITDIRDHFPTLTNITADDISYDKEEWPSFRAGLPQFPTVQEAIDALATDEVHADEVIYDSEDWPEDLPPVDNIQDAIDALANDEIHANEVIFDNSNVHNELSGVSDVQEALEVLDARRDIGCCTVCVYPDDNIHDKINEIPAGADAHVYVHAGSFKLDKQVLLKNKGHIKLVGAGAGTSIVANGCESAIRFDGCSSVTVRDILATTNFNTQGKASHGAPHQNGVLHFEGCGSVTVESCALRCTSGTRPAATCIAVANNKTGKGDIRIVNNVLQVGYLQTGILLINAEHAHVQDNVLKARPRPKGMTFDKMVSDKRFRSLLRRAVVSNMIPSAVEDTSLGMVTVGHGDFSVSFKSYAGVANDWQEAINRTPPKSVRSNAELLHHTRGLIDKAIEKGQMVGSPQFKDWFKLVKEQNPSIMASGIIVAGKTAKDVRVLNNNISSALQGIRVGVSHSESSKGAPDMAGRIQIVGNTIDLMLPPVGVAYARFGIFVGNCTSLAIKDNCIHLSRYSTTHDVYSEAIRVYGTVGRMVIIKQNCLDGFTSGIRFNPLNDLAKEGRQHQWIVAENVLPETDHHLQLVLGPIRLYMETDIVKAERKQAAEKISKVVQTYMNL